MVFSKLTDEEEFLKKQYLVLRSLKKEVKRLTLKRKQEQAATAESGAPASKQKKVIIQGNKTPSRHSEFPSSAPNYNLKVPATFDAAANTEKAKELLKSGAIQVNTEKKTIFKRSSNLTRRLLEGGARKPKLLGSGSDDMDSDSKEKLGKSDGAKAGYKAFNDDERPKHNRRERRTDKKPRKGNTVYVHGFAVSEDVIKKHFSRFGQIINVNMESEKNSAFVSYDSFEAAETAIKEMDDALVEGSCRLKVSLARRQPMLGSIKQAPQATPWAVLSERGDKGSMEGESRTLVSYEDFI